MRAMIDIAERSDRNLFTRAGFELYLSWRFVAGDLSTAWYPALLFTVAAWRYSQGSAAELAASLIRCAVLFWFYIYIFCTSNQARGVAEDRINKPHRPLVAGLVSLPGVYRRFWAAMAIYTALGWLLGVLEWVVLWQAVVIFHNLLGGSKHWLGKNLAMVVGTVAELAAAWQIAAPIGAVGWRWILVVSLTFNAAVAVQDLRDIPGDRATGRRTLPIVAGEWTTRLLVCGVMVALPVLAHFLLFAPASPPTAVLILCDGALASLSWLTAVRCIAVRSRQGDHRTYMSYTYAYCVALLSAAVVL